MNHLLINAQTTQIKQVLKENANELFTIVSCHSHVLSFLPLAVYFRLFFMISELICSNLYSLLFRIQILITFWTFPCCSICLKCPQAFLYTWAFSLVFTAAKCRTLLSQSSLVRHRFSLQGEAQNWCFFIYLHLLLC